MRYPNAKKHFFISMIKSIVRVVGFVFLPFSISVGAIFLIIAELIGVWEEMV